MKITRKSPLDQERFTPMPVFTREMLWRNAGENNGQPVWKLIHGDYEARVNIGFDFETHKWGALVNNNGKLGFESADAAKAYCEQVIRDGIAGRLAHAATAQRLYDIYQSEDASQASL